ncbi:PREDICTED: uncharacterized protein LOC105365692 [Ceratosolen solmsi marchali]|uniref:Uncharacterized protein LOC105365692 n=1 Tax=Ceratosolen solmsi marchali TaxID=326594 RepID=A0AAJ6YQA5_9HYME|nr:PREDICTED: uncharacterized protein LOC105365692 [Ceratosolen solmsi marchali]
MVNIELPYNSYDEFIRDISYKVVVIRGTKEHDDINSDDPLLLPLKDQMVNYWKLPIGLIEAFNEVCTNNVAFYTYEIDLRSLKILSPCPVAGLTVPRITQVSLGLSKYSPYTKMLNYYILNLRDKGIINRLKEYIFFQYDPEIKSKANQISILEVIPILFIWGLGILINGLPNLTL